jgi:hypothetical protein
LLFPMPSLNQKRKIFWPQRLGPQNKILFAQHAKFLSIAKRTCSYLKWDPSYLCGRIGTAKHGRLSAGKRKKVDGRLDDLQTNGHPWKTSR